MAGFKLIETNFFEKVKKIIRLIQLKLINVYYINIDVRTKKVLNKTLCSYIIKVETFKRFYF